jgi:hypothetical protein
MKRHKPDVIRAAAVALGPAPIEPVAPLAGVDHGAPLNPIKN